MKYAVLYSSRTGNTQTVAEAIHAALPSGSALLSVKDVSDASDADVVFFGCWIDRGMADEAARAALLDLEPKRIALFVTLGAYPFSLHALDSQRAVWAHAAERHEVLGCFACQGKVATSLTDRFNRFPAGHPHAMTPARLLRHKEAAGHPGDLDLRNAADYARVISQYVVPGFVN